MQQVEVCGRVCFLSVCARYREIAPATKTKPAEYDITYTPQSFGLPNGSSAVLVSYGEPA